MTYSIVAKNPATQEIGIAVASRFYAVGMMVPYIRPDAAVASQAFCNPLWGIEGVARLSAGEAAQAVIDDFIARDDGRAIRQVHMIDQHDRIAQHTGADCVPWCGHKSADLVSVAGNMLAGPAVVADTLACYLDNPEAPFVERLLLAMEAGENAGGDKRGKQAAALTIHKGQDYPWMELRTDDHADPLAELRRLHAVTQERFVHFREGMATQENFSGLIDRTPIDEAIKRADEALAASPEGSSSFATALPRC